MAEAYYEPTPATDGATMNPVPGAVFQVFEIADTTFSTPLSLRVGSGNPTTTVAASDTLATLPGVYVTSPNFEHIWVSGSFQWRRDSIDGAKGAIERAESSALSAANAAADAERESATSAQAAKDAASLVDAPADATIQTLIDTPGSATRGAVDGAIAEEVPPLAAAPGVETLAATIRGQVPIIDPTPPTVTVLNNQSLDGTGSPTNATSLIPDRKANAVGWYTTIAPTNSTVQRYFAPSAPVNNTSGTAPDKWSVGFQHGGVAGSSFSHEVRVSGGQIVQYMVKQLGGGVFRLLVNGKYLTPTHQVIGGTPGQTAFITVDFGAPLTVPVNITFEGAATRFYGMIHQNASTVTKVLGPDPKKILFAGDSYWQSTGEVTQLTSMTKTAGWLLGYRNNINSSIGGSGYIATGNLSQPNLGNRVTEDIVNQAPDVVVIGMGHNDTSFTNAAIQTAATNAVQAIRTGLPNATIVVTGPMFSTPNAGVYAAMQDAIFAGVSTVSGVKTVDTVTVPWITTANQAKYISSDTVHPVQIGADYFGHRLAAAIAEATAVRF